jgi:hypothetical protein
VADRAEVDITITCNCGSHGDEQHKPDCYRLRHSVRTFMRLIGRSGERGSNQQTEQVWKDGHWERAGWMPVLRDGKLFASKLLCSKCIDRFFERQSMRSEYERKSKSIAPQNPHAHEAYWRSMCS